MAYNLNKVKIVFMLEILQEIQMIVDLAYFCTRCLEVLLFIHTTMIFVEIVISR